MIKVGILGAGFGAKIHLPGFSTIPGVKVIATGGRSSFKAIITDPRIDAVSIATPPAFHYAMASLAIKNGKHVFLEKPVAMNAGEAKKLARQAKAARVILMPDFEFRNIPHLVFAKKILDEKQLGRIRYVNVDWITGGRAKITADGGWQSEKKYGGGVLFGFAPHVIDYLEWLFGPIASVFAKLSVAKRPVAGKTIGRAEDTCNILFQFKNGAIANVSLSNVMPSGRGHWIEIYGDEGALVVGNGNLRDSVYGFETQRAKLGDDAMKKVAIPRECGSLSGKYSDGRLEIFIPQAKKFITSIRAGKYSGPTPQDGVQNQIVLDAIRASDASGTWRSL